MVKPQHNAMLIATADDPKKTRRETRQVLRRLVDAMFDG